MSDESQNQDFNKNSIPPSPQEPIADAPILPMDSEPAEVPSGALESSPNDFSVKSNDIPPSNSTLTEPSSELKPEEKPRENEPFAEPISEPIKVSEPVQAIETSDSIGSTQATAQIPPNEPFENTQNKPLTLEPETKIEPSIQEVESTESINIQVDKPEPVSVSNSGVVNEAKPEPEPEKIIPVPIILSNKNKIFELLAKAKNAIQFRKRKKLNKVMTLFLKKSKITNDEVEKFLHVSDATATRYLSQLEKEGKIKQNGKIGKGVSYSQI